jgi:hypothetical protein
MKCPRCKHIDCHAEWCQNTTDSNSALIDGLDAIRSVLKEADYQDCFLADDEIIKTIRDTVQLAQQSKKLLADIKAWDVQTFLENSKFTMPQDLRKRIHDISGS